MSPTIRLGDQVGTLHLVVSVFALIYKTLCLPKLKKTISVSHCWTLSGHTWSTMWKFSILNLSSLHPYGKPYLGYTARRRFTLLGDGSHCSTMVHNYSATIHNCSATHHGGRTMSLTARLCSHLLGQAQDGVAQLVQSTQGLAVGGTTLDTLSRPHGLHLQGWLSPWSGCCSASLLSFFYFLDPGTM